MKPIIELAIGGGGIKGLAFAGALYKLDELNLLKDLKRISGSSIGGFLAVCISIGFKPSELMDELFEYDYKKIKDVDIVNIFEKKTLMKGEKLRDFFRSIITKKINIDITLKELYEKTNIELIIAVTCINTQSLEYISYKTDPELDIFSLICMTSAIPGMLPPVQYKNKLYVDGGIMDNLPLKVLSSDAWGITSTRDKSYYIPTEKLTYFTHFSIIFKTIYNGFQKELKNTHKNLIKVNVGNVNVTSFNVTKDDKFTLIRSGIEAVEKMFIQTPLCLG